MVKIKTCRVLTYVCTPTQVKLRLSALRLAVHGLGDVRPGVPAVLHVGAVRDLVINGRSDTRIISHREITQTLLLR